MSGISVSIVFFRFLQIVGSLIYFAGVCIVASGALSHGANTFVADLVVALVALLTTVAMATHSIRLRLRPQALQAALLVSARQESRRALRVLLDFFMICVWVGAVMAEIFMPYWIIHGNTYKYGTWPYIWDGLYIGRSMAWITASTLSVTFFISMWLMLAETLHSKKTVPVEPAKLVDEENVQPASLHIDRAEVSTSPPLSERSKARGSFAKDAKSYAPVRRPADHGSKEAKDLPPSYDFKN